VKVGAMKFELYLANQSLIRLDVSAEQECLQSTFKEESELFSQFHECLPKGDSSVWLLQRRMYKATSNLSKAHVTRDSSGPATLAISVGLQQ